MERDIFTRFGFGQIVPQVFSSQVLLVNQSNIRLGEDPFISQLLGGMGMFLCNQSLIGYFQLIEINRRDFQPVHSGETFYLDSFLMLAFVEFL